MDLFWNFEVLLSWSLSDLTDFSLGILLKQENPGVTEEIRKRPHGLKDKSWLPYLTF